MTSIALPLQEPGPPVDTRQEISLAEGVTIHLLVASPIARGLAYGMDLIIRMCAYYAVSIAFAALTVVLGESALGFFLLFLFLMEWFYNVVFEQSKSGATPGQRMLGLRVVSETGAAPTISQSLLRNLLRTADFLPVGYGIGACVALSTRRFQRLGDLAARTLVVHTTHADGVSQRRQTLPVGRVAEPPPPEAPPAPLTAEEQRQILQFEERLRSWSTERQIELAGHAHGLTGSRRGMEAVTFLRAVAAWLGRSSGTQKL